MIKVLKALQFPNTHHFNEPHSKSIRDFAFIKWSRIESYCVYTESRGNTLPLC